MVSGKKNRKKTGSRKRAGGKASIRIKKPVRLRPHGNVLDTHVHSHALAIFWLILLAIVVLGMLASLVIGALHFAIGDARLLLIVAIIGFSFGLTIHKLVTLIGGLGARHHLFARLFVPSALVLTHLVVSSAAGRFAELYGLGARRSPVSISLVFLAGFLLPETVALAAYIRKVSHRLMLKNVEKRSRA